MRLRTAQLACLLLLLTSMGAAERSSRAADFSIGGHYISSLLRQNATADPIETQLSRRIDEPAPHIPLSPFANAAWTMRPPSAHSVRVQAVTSGI
jgi:hypothetical protein